MKCPVCVKEGVRSKVFIGESNTTCMAGSEYYDEDGVYHKYDPNVVTTTYRCSNEHTWTEQANAQPIRELLVEPAPARPRTPRDSWNTLMSPTGTPLGEEK